MAVIRPTALNINKPIGWTSRDVLNKLQSLYSYKKFGHAGSLDPLATGVLVVLVGDECKKQDYYMSQEKTYETRIIFGCSSPTDDLEGPVEIDNQFSSFNFQKIEDYLQSHVGEFEQTVPYYSAVKINGKEMYKSARNNQLIANKPVKKVRLSKYSILHSCVVDKKSNKISIPDKYTNPINLRSDNIKKEYEERLLYYSSNFFSVDLSIDVSKGFYVRSLARDLGEYLGTKALMASLVRKRVGHINSSNSLDLNYFNNRPDLV